MFLEARNLCTPITLKLHNLQLHEVRLELRLVGLRFRLDVIRLVRGIRHVIQTRAVRRRVLQHTAGFEGLAANAVHSPRNMVAVAVLEVVAVAVMVAVVVLEVVAVAVLEVVILVALEMEVTACFNVVY